MTARRKRVSNGAPKKFRDGDAERPRLSLGDMTLLLVEADSGANHVITSINDTPGNETASCNRTAAVRTVAKLKESTRQ